MIETELGSRKRALIFINIVISCIATSMMSTALSTGLPSIIEDFDVTASTAQWMTSGYMLAMAVMMPTTAFLVRRFPTRVLYAAVIAVFLAGVLIDFVAVNFGMLMVGRIMQACSNGILIAMSQMILMSIYPATRHGTILGWYGLALTAAPIVSPAIAGVLIDAMSWRGVFLVPLIIMSVSLVVALVSMVNVLDVVKTRIDIPSFILCAMAFGGISLGVTNILSYGITSMYTLVPLVVGVLGAVLFVRRQLSMDRPFLELRLFRNRRFTVAVIVGMMFYAAILAMSVLMPLYFQSGLGYSATASGVFLLFGSLAVAIITPLAGKWYDVRGIRSMVLFAAFAMLIGNVGLALIGPEVVVAVPVILYTITALSGCQMMPMSAWGINAVEPEHRVDATSLINSLRTLGGALGMSLSMGLMEYVADGSGLVGSEAIMSGMSTTFAALAILSIVILIIGTTMRGSGAKDAVVDQ